MTLNFDTGRNGVAPFLNYLRDNLYNKDIKHVIIISPYFTSTRGFSYLRSISNISSGKALIDLIVTADPRTYIPPVRSVNLVQLNQLNSLTGVNVLFFDNLHAKMYAIIENDNLHVWIGSANFTYGSDGDSNPKSNFEYFEKKGNQAKDIYDAMINIKSSAKDYSHLAYITTQAAKL